MAFQGTITPVLTLSGTITAFLREMANYVINRYDINGLTAGTVPLAGVDISLLKTGNPIVALFFTGSIMALYRLRAKGGDSAVAQWKVISTSDATYLWELVQVTKEGAPCEWNATDSKFYQRITSGATPASGLADVGFQLPT